MNKTAVLILCFGLAATNTFAQDAGRQVFAQRCAGCHGSDGKGKSAIGTPDFTSAKTQSGISDADMIDTITNGRKGTIMPAWKGKLADEEIAAVAAYLRTLGHK